MTGRNLRGNLGIYGREGHQEEPDVDAWAITADELEELLELADLTEGIVADLGPTPIVRMRPNRMANPPAKKIDEITDGFNEADRRFEAYWVHADAVYQEAIAGWVTVVVGDWTSEARPVEWAVPDLDEFKSNVVAYHPELGIICVWYFDAEVKPRPISKEAQAAYATYIDTTCGGGCPI